MRRRVPVLLTSVSGVAVVALVASVALLTSGYAQQKLALDDGSVWVSNAERQLVGHANTEIGSLSTVLDAQKSAVRILQDSGHLILHDTADNTMDIASPSSAKVLDTVPLPNGNPDVLDAGENVVVFLPSTGEAWTVAKADAGDFTAKSAPTLTLGSEASFAVDAEGRYAGYSAESGTLVTGSLDGDGRTATDTVAFSGTPKNVQATLVAGQPALFNPDSGQLWLDGRFVALGTQMPEPERAVLMTPSVEGDRVLLAHSAGLLAVRLADRSVQVVGSAARASGSAAAPIRVAGCEYAAWSGGVGYRMCPTGSRADALREVPLDSVAPGARLELLANGRTVVLNDPANGKTWAVQRDGRLIDNWSDFVDASRATETRQDDRDVPPEIDPQQKPPIAVDDTFGVRAGRANILPVLLNDSDPNGDALIVTAVTGVPAEFGRLDIVDDAQKVQLTTTSSASGSASFRYTIDDGHGGTAVATVTVTVKGPEVNAPPVQVRPTRSSVAAGGTATVSILDDWVDPESDPMYLKDAVATAPDRVSFTPDGRLEYTEGGGGSGAESAVRTIALVVSDGSADGAGTLSITVGQPGTVPIIAESFALTGWAGQDISVAPLDRVRGGTGFVQLTGVVAEASADPKDTAVTVTPDYAAGTVTVIATRAGTYRLEYTVTDGKQNASAVIRLEIAAPPSETLPPVTQPTTAFVYLREPTSVDVLATDRDPGGGVLSLVGLREVPSNLTAGIEGQRALSVTLLRTLDEGPVTFAYDVTNGVATASGTVTIVQIPEPAKLQPPIANPDTASVRVGSVVDVPVLANDLQPNGKPLLLAARLVQDVPSGGGILFTAGDRLRYLAPETPGTYTAVYAISTTDGQSATAPVTMTVRDVDAANNRPPAPRSVEARTTAGQTVRIPIPLNGIDPDGDAVTLSGQATAPQLGAISGIGVDYLEYTAGPYAAGTDTFHYTVVDALGASGTGTVRVGVSGPSGTVTAPVAHDDAVVTRPGTTLRVNVTANDTDPQGDALAVTAIEAEPGLRASHDDDTVSLVAPVAEGAYAVLYTIRNPRGGTASAWLYVQVRRDAPLAGPVAHDIRLGLRDIDGVAEVEVDPLAAVAFSEGGRSRLSLSVPSGFPTVRESGGKLRIGVQATSQIIPFVVARRDDPAVMSMAFIWMPGSDDAKPELKKTASALTIPSGDTLTIELGDRVLTASGRSARLTDAAGVSAAFSNGDPLVAGPTTLRFTSAKDYFGPASISFTVTDAPGDGVGNQATFTLPITVTPKKNQPPVVNGIALSLEAGGQTTVDLSALTDYPYPDARDRLVFSAASGSAAVVAASVSDRTLTLRAIDGAAVGATAKVTVSVRDANGQGTSGAVTVTIVTSTRPLVAPVADLLTIRRGDSATVDVLVNDEATNPFPGRALRVVSLDTSTVPAGIDVRVSADRRTVAVTVGTQAPTGTLTLPYKVADITNDPNRYASATVVVSIQDVPDAPSAAPTISSQSVDDAAAVVTIPATYPNNSPITSYTIRAVGSGPGAECTPGAPCVVRGLGHGTPYRFTVSATNALGEGPPSAPSAPSAPVAVDGTPSAGTVSLSPSTTDRTGASMDLAWSLGSQPAKASAPQSIHVRVTGGGATLLEKDYAPEETGDRIRNATPGVSYTVTMTVTNRTARGPEATAVGVAMSAPVFGSVTVAREGGTGKATVRWGVAPGAGDVRIQVVKGDGTAACIPRGAAAADGSWIDTGAVEQGAVYTVYASNSLFCTAALTNPLDARMVVAPAMSVGSQIQGDRTDIVVQRQTDGANVTRIQYSLVPGASGTVPGSWKDLVGTRAVVTGPGSGYDDGTRYLVFVRACGEYECTEPQRFDPGAIPGPSTPSTPSTPGTADSRPTETGP